MCSKTSTHPIDLLLGLVRINFLTCREKLRVLKNLDNLESLAVLSIEDPEILAGRRLRITSWNGDDLLITVQKDLSVLERYGTGFAVYSDPLFPPLLREIHDPPFGIFWRGRLPDPEKPLAAMVGTRNPSGDGALGAARLGKEFGEAGIPVISGLARGIDAYAHRGNLDGCAPSVAVLACGVERIYPISNSRLAARILESGGAVLSEYPPGEAPLKFRFPQRNRLISGMSRGVVLVEAPEKSGALITADIALDQGRDLMVYKGALESPRSSGCRRLFEEGAIAVSCAQDVLNEWGLSTDVVTNAADNRCSSSGHLIRKTGRQLAFDFRREIDSHTMQRN